MRAFACVVTCFLAAACGSSSSGTDAGGKNDAALYPFGCAGSAACTTADVCCAMPGATTTFGCVATASCTVADQITCDGPEACGSAAPVCCGVETPDGTGTYPQCGLASLGTSCTTASACATHFGATCSDTSKVQLCHVKADCTDATDNLCCTFTSGGASLTFCIDATTAGLGGATCHG
ncbi:MAG TPA: hypothetical protein VMJ10_22155 [Kofleriaceae bacterium]|nr:hypothetical protein [Kofleriaceae bacterium]